MTCAVVKLLATFGLEEFNSAATACRASALMPPPPDCNAWSSVAFDPPVESDTFTPNTVLNNWFCVKPTQESKC